MRILHRRRGSLKAELRAAASLGPLMVLSVLSVVALTSGGMALAHPVFQSPESPVGSPSPTIAPTEPPPAATTETPAAPPTETPMAPSPELTATTVEPAETAVGVPSPTIAAEAETPTVEAEPGATEEPPPEEPSRFSRVAWSTVVDTCVVGAAGVWLCCGGIVLVLFVLGVVASFVLRSA